MEHGKCVIVKKAKWTQNLVTNRVIHREVTSALDVIKI